MRLLISVLMERCATASQIRNRNRRVIAHLFRQPCNLRQQQLLCGIGSNQDAFEGTKNHWHQVVECEDDQSPNSVRQL